MASPIWFFKPGTEERVEVLYLADAEDTERRWIIPCHRCGKNFTERRWIIPCHRCGKNFTLRPDHGVTVGEDGSLTTEHDLNCPVCSQWHVRIRGGVVQQL